MSTVIIRSQDIQTARRSIAELAEEMPHVAVRALNKAMTGVKTDAKAIIRQEYNIKAGALDKRISIRKATRQNITGVVTSKGSAIHHIDIAGTRQGKSGVSVNVKKSTGSQVLPRTFLAPGTRSGKMIVLRRPGKPRGQHATLYGRYGPPGSGGKVGSRARLDSFVGPHPEVLMNAPHNWAKIQLAASNRLDKAIGSEMDAELRRLAGQWR